MSLSSYMRFIYLVRIILAQDKNIVQRAIVHSALTNEMVLLVTLKLTWWVFSRTLQGKWRGTVDTREQSTMTRWDADGTIVIPRNTDVGANHSLFTIQTNYICWKKEVDCKYSFNACYLGGFYGMFDFYIKRKCCQPALYCYIHNKNILTYSGI